MGESDKTKKEGPKSGSNSGANVPSQSIKTDGTAKKEVPANIGKDGKMPGSDEVKDEIKEEIKTEEQGKTVPNAPKEAKKIQNAMMKENQAVPKQAPTSKTDETNIKDAQGKLIPKQSTEVKDKENMEKKETNQTPSLKEMPKDSKKMAELPKVEEKKNDTFTKTEQITKAQNTSLDNSKAGSVRAKSIE